MLGADASEASIQALIARHGTIFVKPVFKGGVGKKGKAGLLGRRVDPQEHTLGAILGHHCHRAGSPAGVAA